MTSERPLPPFDLRRYPYLYERVQGKLDEYDIEELLQLGYEETRTHADDSDVILHFADKILERLFYE